MTAHELTPDAVCRTCKAPIVWVFTRGGNRLPVDPIPVEGGNLIIDDLNGRDLLAIYTQGDATVRHVSHFATCPDAPSHRKARR